MAEIRYIAVLMVLTGFGFTEAGQCCKSFTDVNGKYHPAQWCEDYCCNDLLNLVSKGCCSNPAMAQSSNVDEECTSWIQEHLWVPIVAGVVFLLLIIGCVTCCCCCGCCCCRGKDRTVIVHSPNPGQMTTVQMSTNNQFHAGYDQ